MQPDETPRIPGRVFVPPFLIAIALGLVATGYLLMALKPARLKAYEKTFPTQAALTAACREPNAANAIDIHQTPRCSSAGHLELGATEPGTAAKNVAWAIVGEGANDIVLGQFIPGETSLASLSKLSKATYVLTFIVEDRPADLNELRAAIANASSAEVPDRLVAIAQFATVQRHNGADVRTDRIEFQVIDGAKK